MGSFLNGISTIALAFLEMPRQLREFLCSQNTLICVGSGRQGVEPPVRACGKLAPEISSIKIRLG